MGKNIVILCDGTSNEIEHDRTNILRLYGCLVKSKPAEQIVFYDPGVGTFGAEESAFGFWRKATEIWGLATGWGLDRNVKEAYEFLVHHYDHDAVDAEGNSEPDRIYVLGFSRGAYASRVLAGFIHAFGLIQPTQLNLLDYAYRAYKGIGEKAGNAANPNTADAFARIRLYERTLRPTRPVVHFLGLFDTVASIIEAGQVGLRQGKYAFSHTNRSVAHVRHAVALDERRTAFQPMLWPTGQKHRPDYWHKTSEVEQVAKELWFRGVHGDIGGGYPEGLSALAKIPLAWMINEATDCGLKFTTNTVNSIVLGKERRGSAKSYTKPNPCAEMQNSMTWGWKVLEFIPRRKGDQVRTKKGTLAGFFVPNGERRIVPDDAEIHPSVYACEDIDIAKAHPNLPPEKAKIA
ncbi:MAG: DUF2235 domain-containing protein [Pseudomonadota bacterium]